MKIFILEIAGAVGSRLARLLVTAGDQVNGLYRRPEQGERLAAGGVHATTAIDGKGLTTAIEAARLAGTRRLVLVSVFPEAWRGREVSDTFEHYIAVKKKADADLAATDLDWVILRPAALTDKPGTGRISLASALIHTQITRDDVAATLAALVHAPQIRHKILELTEGSTPIADAVRQHITG
ncbi:NAD(P)-binding oxidoreductase [Nocardia carnea]|uniref:NAD(P)-binding oxidoreductase n=1 Tax=Nocardia carnea TaxID=37328 RepID=UPI002457063E|nr:SDR family oxidoreductase [Nocardia carnea]